MAILLWLDLLQQGWVQCWTTGSLWSPHSYIGVPMAQQDLALPCFCLTSASMGAGVTMLYWYTDYISLPFCGSFSLGNIQANCRNYAITCYTHKLHCSHCFSWPSCASCMEAAIELRQVKKHQVIWQSLPHFGGVNHSNCMTASCLVVAAGTGTMSLLARMRGGEHAWTRRSK